MRFSSYHQAIEVLRNREAEPSFEHIRALVLSQKRSRKILSFWLFVSASVPLLLAFFILFFPRLFGLVSISAIPERFIPAQMPPVSAYSPSPNHASISRIRHGLALSQNNNASPSNSLHVLPDEKTPASLPSLTKDSSIAIVHSQPAAEHPSAATRNQTSPIAEMQSPQIHYSFFVSAGMFPRSGQTFLNLMSGSIGARMYLNNSSSLVLELRRNAFIQKNKANVAHSLARDTVGPGGSTSYDTIRWMTTVQTQSPNNFFSVNAGYRLNFPELHSFSAFIEALAGISAQGGLASELAGLQYSFNPPLSLAIALRSDQLFSRSASPQTALDICISMSFIW